MLLKYTVWPFSSHFIGGVGDDCDDDMPDKDDAESRELASRYLQSLLSINSAACHSCN
jgi:hypothetical protein